MGDEILAKDEALEKRTSEAEGVSIALFRQIVFDDIEYGATPVLRRPQRPPLGKKNFAL